MLKTKRDYFTLTNEFWLNKTDGADFAHSLDAFPLSARYVTPKVTLTMNVIMAVLSNNVGYSLVMPIRIKYPHSLDIGDY